MTEPSKKRRFRFFARGFLLLAILFGVFLPEIYSVATHLYYGNPVVFTEWKIPVPPGWSVHHGGIVVSLGKMSRSYLWSDDGGRFMIFYRDPAQRFADESEYARYRQKLTAIEERNGYRSSGDRRVTIGDMPSSCMEFSAKTDSRQIHIYCLIWGQELAPRLLGEEKDKELFYDTLQRLIPPKTPQTPPPTDQAPRKG